jgi:hypothetical protein
MLILENQSLSDDDPKGTNIAVQDLWSKYEDIAMHFNDLLMRLRTQSLAGIAAVSTLVGLFTKETVANIQMGWLAATAIFTAMAAFWIAIWCLDFLYYNRLLIGAVTAIRRLEAKTGKEPATSIDISTTIESEFKTPLNKLQTSSALGVLLFYGIVLAVILSGVGFSAFMYAHTPSTSAK